MLRTATVCAMAILTLMPGCAPSPSDRLESNKDLVRRFIEATNAADWDALAELVATDLTRHSAATPGPPVTSRDEFITLQKEFLATFPDQHVTVKRLVAEGDLISILATYSGTQTGPMGEFPATGRQVQAPFLGMLRIDAGKIAEMWVEWDNLAMLSQLGLLPSNAASSSWPDPGSA